MCDVGGAEKLGGKFSDFCFTEITLVAVWKKEWMEYQLGGGKLTRKYSTVQAGSKLWAGFARILFSIFSLGDQNVSLTKQQVFRWLGGARSIEKCQSNLESSGETRKRFLAFGGLQLLVS